MCKVLQASGRPRASQQLGDTTARIQEAALAQTSPQRLGAARQKASSGSGGRSGSGALLSSHNAVCLQDDPAHALEQLEEACLLRLQIQLLRSK